MQTLPAEASPEDRLSPTVVGTNQSSPIRPSSPSTAALVGGVRERPQLSKEASANPRGNTSVLTNILRLPTGGSNSGVALSRDRSGYIGGEKRIAKPKPKQAVTVEHKQLNLITETEDLSSSLMVTGQGGEVQPASKDLKALPPLYQRREERKHVQSKLKLKTVQLSPTRIMINTQSRSIGTGEEPTKTPGTIEKTTEADAEASYNGWSEAKVASP